MAYQKNLLAVLAYAAIAGPSTSALAWSQAPSASVLAIQRPASGIEQINLADSLPPGIILVPVQIENAPDAMGCNSAWKKDPRGGVIGVQKGPLC